MVLGLFLVGLTGLGSAQFVDDDFNYLSEDQSVDGVNNWSNDGSTDAKGYNSGSGGYDFTNSINLDVGGNTDTALQGEIYKDFGQDRKPYKITFLASMDGTGNNGEAHFGLYDSGTGNAIFDTYGDDTGDPTSNTWYFNGDQVTGFTEGRIINITVKNIDYSSESYDVVVRWDGNTWSKSYSSFEDGSVSSVDSFSVWATDILMLDDLRVFVPNQPGFNSVETEPSSWTLNSGSDFSYNVSDDSQVDSVTLEVFNSTSGGKLKEETFSYSSSSIQDTQVDWFTPNNIGNYTVYYTATDNNGDSTVQTLDKEVTDFKPPNISYNSSTTEEGTYSRDWIFVNVTASDNDVLNKVTEEFDNSNSSFSTNQGRYYWTNHTGLSDGTYSFRAFAEDNSGNTNITKEKTVTLDTTPANLSTESPLNQTYRDSSVDLNVISDEVIDTWTRELDNSNSTFSPNTTLTALSDGVHTVQVYASDTEGNIGSANEVSFTVDTKAPSSLTVFSPANQTYTDPSSIDENVAGSDATSGISSWYVTRNAGSESGFTPNGSSTWTEGQHNITFKASDKAANNKTKTVYFYINMTPPDGYVQSLPSGKAVGLRSDPLKDLSKVSNSVERLQDVVFGNSQGKNLSVQLRVNMSESNVSAQHLEFDTDRQSGKSFIHNVSSISNTVNEKTLLIPRVDNTGKVHICPAAESLSDTQLGCNSGYNVSSGNTKNGVTVSEVTVNGQDYYEAKGINGTGGVEVGTSSSSGGIGSSTGGDDDSTSESGPYRWKPVTVGTGYRDVFSIDKDAESSFAREIRLKNTGNNSVTITAECFSKNYCEWIEISDDEITVEPGSEKIVEISGKIPGEVKGQQFAAVIRFTDPSFTTETPSAAGKQDMKLEFDTRTGVVGLLNDVIDFFFGLPAAAGSALPV